MPLNTQDFNTIVANEIAAAQASSSALLDFSVGSVLLALIQANASSVALWLQALSVYNLALTRAATSNGADLDSWMADFGFSRLPAISASGNVQFSRANATVQAVVPVGAIVQTTGGTVSYTVIVDTTNVNYNAALNGYVLTVSTASINVPVQANTPGAIGNASINAINTINTPIAYVDTVANSAAFANGVNSETDAAFRIRFVAYLASLSRATNAAISYAVSSVQGVVDFTITENQAYNGSTQYGYFYVVVDDGTGTPPGSLLTSVSNAINAVVGLTINFGVFSPVVETANVTMTISVVSGFNLTQVETIVTTALQNYISMLRLGNTLYYSRLYEVAYDASPGVLNVSSVTLNSGTSDLVITNQQLALPGTITVT